MRTDITQGMKDRLSWIENHLRIAGQKLDALWQEARTAKGQAKTVLHKQIGPLREKQRVDREEQEVLKKGGDIAVLGEISEKIPAAVYPDYKFESSTRT